MQTDTIRVLVIPTDYLQLKDGSLLQDPPLTLDKVKAAVFNKQADLMLVLHFTLKVEFIFNDRLPD